MLGEDWLNVDLAKGHDGVSNYLYVNLIEIHPFQDETFQYAFGEDFLEHLSQSESILFLTEAFRSLKRGGVLRLSFPGLEGVLKKHYTPTSYEVAKLAISEAYTMWGHHHFYSKGELELVACHLGFSEVHFCKYGESIHEALSGIDSRSHQPTLNTYAELIK